MKILLLASLEVVILTTSNAASDKNFIKMTSFLFKVYDKNQCNINLSDMTGCEYVRE